MLVFIEIVVNSADNRQVGVAYTEDLARILSSLGYLSWVICCGAIYEQLYIDLEQGSITDIQDCLIKQYVSILEYLLCAKKHLEKNTGGKNSLIQVENKFPVLMRN
jgi:hypothetical protein